MLDLILILTKSLVFVTYCADVIDTQDSNYLYIVDFVSARGSKLGVN